MYWQSTLFEGLCEIRKDLPDEKLLGGDEGDGMEHLQSSVSEFRIKGQGRSLQRGNGVLNNKWSDGWGLKLMRTTLTAMVQLVLIMMMHAGSVGMFAVV